MKKTPIHDTIDRPKHDVVYHESYQGTRVTHAATSRSKVVVPLRAILYYHQRDPHVISTCIHWQQLFTSAPVEHQIMKNAM